MEASKRSGVLVWASIAAAATGIVAVAAILKWKERNLQEKGVTSHLRDVQDVLADCYQKIREIETHLPEILAPSATRTTIRSGHRTRKNGKPVFET